MISLPETAFLALAAYRGTQLVVHDSILDPWRDRLEAWYVNGFREGGKEPGYWRRFVRTLLGCTYCTGWWVSAITLLTYLLATGRWDDSPLLVHGIEAFAVAGGQALLNRWDDSREGH